MIDHRRRVGLFLLLVAISSTIPGRIIADDTSQQIAVADGKIILEAPESWQRKKPQTNIIEHEFAAPKAEGDEADGRLTVMGAGGSIDDNINRWIGQFTQPDGGSTKERATVKKLAVGGQEVHWVDISGTFKDQRGPFAPAVEREGYRMLAAIIVTKNSGNYFVKFYGPQKTIAENEKPFKSMIEGLRAP